MSSYYEKFLATGEVKCIDDEIPFEIPQGWEWCRLKHMCSMQAGKNISASEIYDEKSVLHPYRCVGGNGLRGFTNTFNAEGHFAIIGRQGALCGCLNMESGKFYATEHAVVVNGFGIIPSLFIYYFFTALNLNQYATATAQPGLAVSNIVEVFIPLPPLPEQLRIVSKIEKLLPLVKTYEQAQNGLNELNASLNEQLRKSILQEAIQGKLVPQIAEEGTAEKLLTEISEEKERLIKEGKLKKSALTDSIIFKGDDNKYWEKNSKIEKDITDEIPFEIPDSWVWCRLSNLVLLLSGRDLELTQYNSVSNGIPYMTGASNFKNGILIKNRWTDTPIVISVLGDLLITCKGTIGEMAFNTIGDIHIARQIMAIRSSFVDLNYIQYYLSANLQVLQRQANSMIPGISRGTLLNAIVPLPPLMEQARIVAIIKHLASIMSR